jgi:hypothetical protein
VRFIGGSFCASHRGQFFVHRRQQLRPQPEQQRFKFRLIEHRRLDQQRAGPLRNKRRIRFDEQLDLLGRFDLCTPPALDLRR